MIQVVNLSFELLSLVIGLIGIFYLLLGTKLVDHKLFYAARLILGFYIFFIIAKLLRVLNLANALDIGNYIAIPGLLSIISLTMAMWYLNKEFKGMIFRKKRKK